MARKTTYSGVLTQKKEGGTFILLETFSNNKIEINPSSFIVNDVSVNARCIDSFYLKKTFINKDVEFIASKTLRKKLIGTIVRLPKTSDL